MNIELGRRPVLELKNVKHSEFASHETHCFTATLYVDGKKFAETHNQGFGGETDIRPFSKSYDDVIALGKWVEATYPRWSAERFGGKSGETYPTSLEIVISELVTEWLQKKDLKRLLKSKIVMFGAEGLSTVNRKPDANAVALIAAKYPSDIVLNTLPFDEAFKIYKDA